MPAGSLVAEGDLSPAAAAVQRADIAAAGGAVLARLASSGYRLVHRYESVPLLALEVDARALSELEAAPLWVQQVIEDALNKPSLPDSVPLIGGPAAWTRGFDGSGVVVAILDSGVESTHPFLAGKVVEEACYSSTVAGHSETFCPNGSNTQIGAGAAAPCSIGGCYHGTHVAGIAAGNGAGAGVPFSGVAKGAQIMAVQVFSKFTSAQDCGGQTPCALAYISDIIAGLERVYAVRGTRNLSSANLSLGGGLFTSPCDGEPEKPIIDNLRSVGIATVIAAGNDGSATALESPGCISSAISVGSTTKTDTISSFSNVAPFMSLFAPGSSIYSSVTGGGFGVLSGTSMATPHVTGAWAVLKQGTPAATVSQILSALQSTGLPITDTRTGVTKPRIRLDQALAQMVPPSFAVTAVTPNQGTAGAAVPVTIDGTGFVSGATVSAGAGITVSNVAFVSSARLTATFTIGSGASAGPRDVTVTNPGGASAIRPGGFTVTTGTATLALVYNGKVRDRVHGDN
ncbi:MAG TPA: S8 family serine peptidase, partial [Vicinamibacterales bacterium]|nr:S8 family serine peptidase [Vicinamibacterales bacterium]